MKSISASRQGILSSVWEATGGRAKEPARIVEAYRAIQRSYIHAGELDAEARLSLLVERLKEYGAEIAETSPENISAAISSQLKLSKGRCFVVPNDIPREWLVSGFEWRLDAGLAAEEIEQCDGVLTAASAAIADSGTIVLHHGAMEGRRVLTLLPDIHICVLFASQVLETLPEYFQMRGQLPEFVTWVSGPSATADIEMTRIKGVHGPRFLHVVLVRN
jgi:L-lactate dehydrogenase complex protein LldG